MVRGGIKGDAIFIVIQLGKRPQNYEELIIENWNTVVQPTDVVYHLGDVIFAKMGELQSILQRLRGIKVLILGNHDRREKDWYIKQGFSLVVDHLMTTEGILLSHAPRVLADDVIVNVHGHFHLGEHRGDDPWYDELLKRDNRYRLLALENENYRPVLLKEFVKRT